MNRPAPWQSLTAGLLERRPLRIGGAVVDPLSRDAKWAGGQERLQPQTLKVLVTLAGRREEVVTRDELVQLCWDGRIVGDDVINRSISLLRHFAEQAGGFEIETVPRTGYRLVENGSSASSKPKRWWIAAVATFSVVLVVALASWSFLAPRRASQGVPPTPSMSVVPFTSESSDPLTRQIAKAAPISIEHMMADSGFVIVHGDSSAAAKAGQNEYAFTGNVRRTPNSIEATVQLVSKRDGTIVYAHDFSAPQDRAADLPAQIGAAIAAELAWIGAQMALDPNEHLSPEITSELMSALQLTIEHGDSLRAYQLARHAAVAAPNSAFAQLSLAVQTGFSIYSIPRGERAEAVAIGRRAAERARMLAPEVGDAYLIWCMLHSPVRMTECEAQVRYALKIDSSSSFVPGHLSTLFYEAGRIDEALPLARQSIANDPYKPAKISRMIRMLEGAGNSSEAEQYYREGRRLWPDSGRMRAGRLIGMAERGNYAGLQVFADRTLDSEMIDPPAFTALLAAQRNHDLGGAERACNTKGITDFTLTLCMTILADLGDPDRSYAIAARSYPVWRAAPGESEDRIWLDEPDGFYTAILDGPAARAMRTDQRFVGLADKLGLLKYWRSERLPDFCRPPHPEPVCAQLRAGH